MDSFALIIFGITSNLAQLKLIPAIYDMAEKGILPENISIVGTARRELNEKEFKSYIHETLHTYNKHHQHEIKEDVFNKLIHKFHYVNGNLDDPSFYTKLEAFLQNRSQYGENCNNRIYYLATYPDLYKDIFQNLQQSGMNKEDCGWVRLMIEKPIGTDLQSAKELNELLLKYFKEDQIYRLDHYLGKETLQNILMFRFSNGILEPLMNNDYIDHIQITAAENFGIGQRGGYYDTVGALKDVGQNHQLQMLAFATMDAPAEFSNEAITKERLKIIQSLAPLPNEVIYGQYEGYLEEPNVTPHSKTETFYALKTFVDIPRLKSVPIYIRAGKKLAQTVTEITIVFKTPDNRLFKHLELGSEPNLLIYRLQPNEGIVLKIFTKKPGHMVELEPDFMQYCYRIQPNSNYIPDPYERLINDTIKGDQTFFNDAKEVEAQWEFVDPLTKSKPQPIIYKPGTWGPNEANKLIEKDGRHWIEPSMEFCRI